MEDPAVDTTDAPLLFAVRYLIREYRNCIAHYSSFWMRTVIYLYPPDDHPVALGIPLPHFF